MARRPANTAPESFIATDAETAGLPALAKAADERALQLIEIDSTYGAGLPYDLNRVVHEYNIHIGNASNSLIEAGKCVILIREHEPRGEFDRIVEERLGLGRSSAYRFMSATKRLLQLDPQIVQPAGRIGKEKLLELMVDADNEDLEELAAGGTFAGLTLDEMECMTKRELVKALRDSRSTANSYERLLAEKDQKLNKLAAGQTPAQKVALTDWPAAFEGYRQQAAAAKRAIEKALSDLDVIRTSAMDEQISPAEQAGFDSALESLALEFDVAISRAEQRVADVRRSFDQSLGAWLDGGAAQD